MKTFHTEISVLAGNLFKLERCGRYEEALAELRHIWEDTNNLPEVDGLAPRAAAEVILRCGAVIGFLGHIKQIPNSQEKSKNLLTEAHNRFFDIYDVEKIAECENYLALAYWRTGELVEAETWIEESLSQSVPDFSQVRLYSHIIKCLIYIPAKKHFEIISDLKNLENEFLTFGDDCLKGDFYNHYGLALKNIGETSKAMEKLELARHFHQKSGHFIYLGTVENNLSQLYKAEKKFAEAHKTIDSANKIFKQIKDRTREGFSLDTKAQIFCDEGKYAEALKAIEKAIFILSKSENAAYIIETYLSKAKILLHLENSIAAFLCLSDAVQIAKTKISEEKAENLVKEFESLYKEKNKPVITKTFSEKETGKETLEIILHPTIAHYSDIQGVWIKNSHLESFGLKKGSLAVVTKAEIKRGDLVAINEIATNSVLCGFYDSDFGLICLEGVGEEPRLFDEHDIEILGKIVGVGKSDEKAKGKIQIKPLNF